MFKFLYKKVILLKKNLKIGDFYMKAYVNVLEDRNCNLDIKFNDITKKMEALKNKRNEIVHKSNISLEEYKFLESYIEFRSINATDFYLKDEKVNIKRNLIKNNFDFEMLSDIFEIRAEMIDMEIEDLNENSIESSYIFENTFYTDLLDDVKFSILDEQKEQNFINISHKTINKVIRLK